MQIIVNRAVMCLAKAHAAGYAIRWCGWKTMIDYLMIFIYLAEATDRPCWWTWETLLEKTTLEWTAAP